VSDAEWIALLIEVGVIALAALVYLLRTLR